jgi:hypothetical protein
MLYIEFKPSNNPSLQSMDSIITLKNLISGKWLKLQVWNVHHLIMLVNLMLHKDKF